MPVPLEKIGLEQDLVELDYKASTGFGKAYRSRAEEQSTNHTEYLFAAASSFRRAGASALLLGDQQSAMSAFAEAGLIYTILRSSEAYVMRTLSSDDSPFRGEMPHLENSPLLDRGERDERRAKLIYALLSTSRPNAEFEAGFGTLWESARADYFSGSALGLLDIPADAYLDLCNSVFHYRNQGDTRARLQFTLSLFLSAYDAAIQSAVRNASSWRLLVQRIHPAEPDIIGLFSMVHLALKPTVLPELLSELPMSGLCRALLFGSMETRFPDDFGEKTRSRNLREM